MFELTGWHDLDHQLSCEVESYFETCVLYLVIYDGDCIYYHTTSMVVTLDPHRTVQLPLSVWDAE